MGQHRSAEWIRGCKWGFVSTVRAVGEDEKCSQNVLTWLGGLNGDKVVLNALVNLKALMTGECRLSAPGSYVMDDCCSNEGVFRQLLRRTAEQVVGDGQ